CDDVAFLPSVSKDCELRKDSARAGRLREQGNASFRARDFSTAALYYSQALCGAALGSDQIALCYANRSAALFHLHLHQECLEDIRRALDHNYPTHLQQKLLERRQQCLIRLRQLATEKGGSKDSKENRAGTTLEDEWTGALPRLSPRVLFRFSPEKGRHLVARERISAGEVVLEERAFGSVLIPGTAFGPGAGKCAGTEVQERAFGTEDLHCHHCLYQTRNPVPCPGCSYARYCGEACQQEAWEGHHRWECSVAAELQAMGILAHLAVRMAFRAGFEAAQQVRGHLVGPATSGLEMPNKTGGCVTMEGSDGREQISSQGSAARNENPVHCCSTILDPPLDGSYLCVHHLLPHVSGQAPSLRFLCAVTAAVLCQRLRRTGSLPLSWRREAHASDGHSSRDENEDWSPELSMLGAVILRHILQLRCNAQAVTILRDSGVTKSVVSSVHEVRIATAVFPTLSLLNHSCTPNTSLAFGKGVRHDRAATGTRPNSVPGVVTVTVRATQTAGPGQELLHCYGEHISTLLSPPLSAKEESLLRMPVKERQQLLLDQYFFLCQCEACSQDLASKGEGQRTATASGLQCTHCQSPLQTKQRYIFKQPLTGLSTSCWRHTRCWDSWLTWQPERRLPWYGEDSAELGQQLFKLVQLHFNGGEARKALPLIPKAMHLLSLHFGPCCEEMEELRAMEDCLQRAL
ncbi:SET and MYND domain-containing protein 4-like, partial [Scleropages formosus]